MVTSPTLVNSKFDNKTGTTALTTGAFTVTAGNLIVVKGFITGSGTISTPAGTGLTFTSRVTSASGPKVQIWTAPVSSTGSVTITAAHTSNQTAFVVEEWSSAALDATPVTIDSAVSTTNPNVAITTEGADSIITWGITDNNETAVTNTPTYRPAGGSAVEEIKAKFSGAWTYWSVYNTGTGSAGAKTVGWSALTGSPTISGRCSGIEILYQSSTITHNIGLITVSETPQAPTRRKLRNIGLVSESNAPQALTRRKLRNIGLVAESETPQAITRRKLRSIGLVSESEAPQHPTLVKVRGLGLAAETNTPQAVTRRKLRTLGLVSESESPQALHIVKVRAIGLVTESNTPQALDWMKVHQLGLISESEAAQALQVQKLFALGLAAETNLAEALSSYKVKRLGLALEHNTVQTISHFIQLLRDLNFTIGPTRSRVQVTVDVPSRASWTIAEARLFWSLVETTLRRVVDVEVTRSRAQATIADTRGSTEVGLSRLGVDIAPSRNDRGE